MIQISYYPANCHCHFRSLWQTSLAKSHLWQSAILDPSKAKHRFLNRKLQLINLSANWFTVPPVSLLTPAISYRNCIGPRAITKPSNRHDANSVTNIATTNRSEFIASWLSHRLTHHPHCHRHWPVYILRNNHPPKGPSPLFVQTKTLMLVTIVATFG